MMNRDELLALIEKAKGRYAPDMVRLADFVVRHADAFAGLAHQSTAAQAGEGE